MSRITFNTRPVLQAASELLTLGAMAGLTVTAAAAWATSPTPVVHQLPTVYVTAKAPVVHQLPTVVVVGKRTAAPAA